MSTLLDPSAVLTLAEFEADMVLRAAIDADRIRPGVILAVAGCEGREVCRDEYGCQCSTRCWLCRAEAEWPSRREWCWNAIVDGMPARVTFDLCTHCCDFLQPVIGGDRNV
ncbi:hypothetical protein GCM10027599_26680 [Yimella radicis]